PLAIMLLSSATGRDGDGNGGLRAHVRSAITQPIVWAPLLGLAVVLTDVDLPRSLDQSLLLLGSASSGVALFAVGILIYCRQLAVTPAVVTIAAARNVAIPLALWGILALTGMGRASMNEAVTALAMPSGSICAILAVNYKVAEMETSSALVLSTLAS